MIAARIRLLGGVALACLAVGIGAPSSSVLPARADVADVAPCTADGDLVVGSQGAGVACVQYFLLLTGLYDGPVNSQFDAATSDAVARFQLANPPLRVDGLGTEPTLVAMGLFSGFGALPPADCLADADVVLGTTGDSAECLQTRLTTLGFYSGVVDGVFGRSSADALIAYQFATPGLTPDGVGGTRTLAALDIWSGLSTHTKAQAPSGAPAPTGGPWPAPRLFLPEYNLTAGGIPFYGNRGICSLQDANAIAAEFANDGANDETQQWAVYVASREGGCNFLTVNNNPATRDDSHCTFQLNALSGMFNADAVLGRRGWTVDTVKQSMKNCADAASDLWVYCGRGPWTPPYSCIAPWAGDLGADGDA